MNKLTKREYKMTKFNKKSTLKKIEAYTYMLVKMGFASREDIIQEITEFIEEEFELPDAEMQAIQVTDKLLEEHLAEQAAWPEKTDCDRIDAAFSALEKRGIVARQNFTWCLTDGRYEIQDEIEEASKTSNPIGFVFYHWQDAESALKARVLGLAYGSVNDDETEYVEIGKIIQDTLEEYGFTVEWDGTAQKRICIKNLDWKKRR